MNEIYEMAFIIGCGLSTLGIIAPIVSNAVSRCWSWVDDSKMPDKNAYINWLNIKVFGYEYKRDPQYQFIDVFSYFKDGKKQEISCEKAVVVASVLGMTPVFLVFSFQFYEVTLGFVIMYLMAHLTRYARRHKKVFDKHVKDPEAHKAE